MSRLAKAVALIQREVRMNSICFAGKLTIVVGSGILGNNITTFAKEK